MPVEVLQCPYCERTCAGGTGLSAHIRSMHPKEKMPVKEELKSVGTRPTFDENLRTTPPIIGKPVIMESKTELVWEDPPQRGSQGLGKELRPVMIELKRHPGKWARVRVFKHKSSANSAKNTLKKSHPDFEYVSAQHSTGSALWMRFVEIED